MKKRPGGLRGNHRGSGVVTVLIAMLFISTLGAALLFTSYTGYQVKIAGRRANENFYDADTAMSQVRAGVQRAVTESLAGAYTDVLEHYSALVSGYENGKDLSGASLNKTDSSAPDYCPTLDAYLESYFQTKFILAVQDWKSDGTALIGADRTVNADVLKSFLSPPAGATVTLTAGSYQVDRVGEVCRLRNIACTYTDEKGYQTVITTDITMKFPPFSYAPAGYLVSGLDRYALIALGGLDCGGAYTLSGNANLGGVTVNGGGRSLAYSGGTLVCHAYEAQADGGVTAANGGGFSTAEGSELWAGNVTLSGGSSRVSLGGSSYVANDLTLDGKGSNVTLKGSYYGFGSDLANPDKSSAILVNGRESKLDMSGLNRLMLSGGSFIDATRAVSGSACQMGQSVATRSDQLAYLVPKGCLQGGVTSNPWLVKEGVDVSAAANEMWSYIKNTLARATGKTYYANVSGVKPVYVNLASSGTQQVAYFFMTFADQDHANAFFKGYFGENKGEVTSYLRTYLDVYAAPGSAESAGETYSGSLTALGLRDAASVGTLAASYQSAYEHLWVTGSKTKPSGDTDPYTAAVNVPAVDTLSGKTYFYPNGDSTAAPVAVIVKDPSYTAESGIRIIIATGNVTVNGPFSGLILSAGKIIMNGNITNDSAQVTAALQATAGNGRTVLSYLNGGSNTTGGGSGESSISWDVDALVGYSGWKKS